MKRTSLTLLLLAALTGWVRAANADEPMKRDPMAAVKAALPACEASILLDVGREYGLRGDALKLLLVIRKIENGRPGYEMGVASDFPRHRSHRYAGDPARSLRVQARWAAGTIQKHFRGDLAAFARIYCPPRAPHWTAMARCWMEKA